MARTLLFTGDGKGKTTAALGCVLRASGHGMRILIVQFIKGRRDAGEYRALARLDGVELFQFGRGFVRGPDAPGFEEHVRVAREGLAYAANALGRNEHEVYVLDEICGAIAHGLLDIDAVMEALGHVGSDAILILTGRSAPAKLMELADTVTEMRQVKHGMEQGIKALDGVEK